MTRTLLREIVERQVTTTLVATTSRTIDRLAESMAEELLRDPATRQELQALVLDAFRAAVAELRKEREDAHADETQEGGAR